MTEEIIIAGFGGQGVLSMGGILAYAGVMQEKEVTWMPSYGPEMRGGTSNVTVIISDEMISSPILNEYDTAIVLNQPSLDKFEAMVKKGGTLIYDGNGITKHPERKDINIFRVDAAEAAANELNNPKVMNMVVLGGLLETKPIILDENIKKGLEKALPERHHRLIPLNLNAVAVGRKIIKAIQTV